MKKQQLIEQLMQYPAKLGESLKTYHQLKRQAERLEAKLAEQSDVWPNAMLSHQKSDEYQEIETQLAEVKDHIDTTEETITALQAHFEVAKVIARSDLYTED